MKKFLIAIVSLIAASAISWQLLGLYWKYEYGQKAPKVSLTVSGVSRHYYLFVPDNLTEPAPLVLAFHGGGGGGWRFPQQFLFEELAAAEGFIMAFPEAEHVEPNEGGWQLNSRADWMQDINYVSAVIDDIGSGYSIDKLRVYGIGYSLGSMFIYELACHMTDRFAALASYAGTMPVNPNYCEQVRPIPLLHVHGKNDGIVLPVVQFFQPGVDVAPNVIHPYIRPRVKELSLTTQAPGSNQTIRISVSKRLKLAGNPDIAWVLPRGNRSQAETFDFFGWQVLQAVDGQINFIVQ